MNMQLENPYLDPLLAKEQVAASKFENVRTVLVVISSAGMVLDRESVRHKILATYSGAAVFFMTGSGGRLGPSAPKSVDLVIDLSAPGFRHKWFLALRLNSMARFTVGRDAGLFRARVYDRIYREGKRLTDVLVWERKVQREVFALAGIAFTPTSDVPADRAHEIALSLPPMARI
ncbi:MAG: hypothetical protein AAB425_13850 [Bdellovibrionota bacterium]